MAKWKNLFATTCRFDKKKTADWVIEGPRKVSNQSVISSNHYDFMTFAGGKNQPGINRG
jgi:NADH-quinone oxidoreductase subunit G